MIKRPSKVEIHMKPTPIQQLSRIDRKLYIKRDDRTGYVLGGNKVRKLEYLLKDALDSGAKRIITCGGIQSNHARATAFAAKELGLEVGLLLRGEISRPEQGNLFLNTLVGAQIRTITPSDWENKDVIMEEWADSWGETYVIPEGGSNALGAWGYVSAFEELIKQGSFEHVFHATGSGGTAAGLLAGRQLTNSNETTIHTINVCDDEAYFKKRIENILSDFEKNYELSVSLKNFAIHDGYVGEGYALASDDLIQKIHGFCRETGILLDPVYTGKAFFAMLEILKRDDISGKVLFIHTGGAFANFDCTERYSV